LEIIIRYLWWAVGKGRCMQSKIIKIGTSKGVVLNNKLLSEFGAMEGDKLDINIVNGEIIIKKENNLEKEMAEYFTKNGPIEERLVFQDSDSSLSDLEDEWVWK
jgi:antitoxin component of MazEF toxin-antitoxin module